MPRVEEDLASPYYLHPSENPSLILITNPLNGSNYHTWNRAMRMALLSKNKLKFVDGSIPVPQRDDQTFAAWERCNTMVTSWIYRAVSPSIAQSITWFDNALDVWNDLKERFAQADSFRIADLQTKIYAFQQHSLNVTDYFTQLKILWDELSNLRPALNCSCNLICNCGALQVMRNYHANDCVIKFLKGLNESFTVVRSQIMIIDPLPPINKVFLMVL